MPATVSITGKTREKAKGDHAKHSIPSSQNRNNCKTSAWCRPSKMPLKTNPFIQRSGDSIKLNKWKGKFRKGNTRFIWNVIRMKGFCTNLVWILEEQSHIKYKNSCFYAHSHTGTTSHQPWLCLRKHAPAKEKKHNGKGAEHDVISEGANSRVWRVLEKLQKLMILF